MHRPPKLSFDFARPRCQDDNGVDMFQDCHGATINNPVTDPSE